ncbi:MAG: 1-acyl-sn-glycerol-3-phosphate acyltransferase [Firmicutes bacterium]|nr:1-acyl-sn-glycerol-3-phosphate acyltransferase [Bacillota bacterium]MCL5040588.1 1-acyl-sn-glycerol-3-phosphate acyltransferase [Bacillota bacterium]
MYVLIRGLFSLFFHLFFLGWKAEGLANLPQEGAVILYSNHISWWDPPLVGCVVKRPVCFMAKEELFRIPIIGQVLPLLGAFPVRRGTADRAAIRRALEILKEGRVLGIFPEGTRSKSGQLQKAEPGTALLAIKSRASLVPVAILGPYRPFRPIRVRIGQPFFMEEFFNQRVSGDILNPASRKIMERIAALVVAPDTGKS